MKSSSLKLKSSQENDQPTPPTQLQRPMSGNDVIIIREDSLHHEKRVNLEQPIKV